MLLEMELMRRELSFPIRDIFAANYSKIPSVRRVVELRLCRWRTLQFEMLLLKA